MTWRIVFYTFLHHHGTSWHSMGGMQQTNATESQRQRKWSAAVLRSLAGPIRWPEPNGRYGRHLIGHSFHVFRQFSVCFPKVWTTWPTLAMIFNIFQWNGINSLGSYLMSDEREKSIRTMIAAPNSFQGTPAMTDKLIMGGPQLCNKRVLSCTWTSSCHRGHLLRSPTSRQLIKSCTVIA